MLKFNLNSKTKDEVIEALDHLSRKYVVRRRGSDVWVEVPPDAVDHPQDTNNLQGLAQFDRKINEAKSEINVIIKEHGMSMDRLREKLKQAAGAGGRISSKIEARADAIIAKELALGAQEDRAFAPHEALLDQASQGLQEVEDSLRLLSNAPLPGSTS